MTGGDSGIGRAAVIAFAREGADVAINYLPDEEADAQEVLALIRAEGAWASGLPGDIKSEAFCQQLVADAVRELGGLDIVVNNAGKQHATESILELTTEQFDATFKTNVYAMFWITKAAVPHLPAGASIINTTSVQAYDPSESLLDYAQTKAAQVAFTKSLAGSVGQEGHPGERGGSRTVLDGVAGQRRTAAGKDQGIWQPDAAGPARPAGGVGPGVRAPRLARGQLYDRPGLWRVRRHGQPLKFSPSFSSPGLGACVDVKPWPRRGSLHVLRCPPWSLSLKHLKDQTSKPILPRLLFSAAMTVVAWRLS